MIFSAVTTAVKIAEKVEMNPYVVFLISTVGIVAGFSVAMVTITNVFKAKYKMNPTISAIQERETKGHTEPLEKCNINSTKITQLEVLTERSIKDIDRNYDMIEDNSSKTYSEIQKIGNIISEFILEVKVEFKGLSSFKDLTGARIGKQEKEIALLNEEVIILKEGTNGNKKRRKQSL